MTDLININKEWKKELNPYFTTSNWQDLSSFIRNEYLNKDKKIFPNPKDIFKAFNLTPFSKVKVVILGQDPYHNDNQAEGLSFSVPKGLILPPSLKNVYKEIESDLSIKKDFTDGNLEKWAKQGVFLLNSILTVIAHNPASHQNKGWEEFTDYVIKKISDDKENIVFILWGNYAKSKKVLIDTNKHVVLESAHPSPFSAYNGFFSCKHFSKCNEYLKKHKKGIINW
jgi:uracil-DNA glycosylase